MKTYLQNVMNPKEFYIFFFFYQKIELRILYTFQIKTFENQ